MGNSMLRFSWTALLPTIIYVCVFSWPTAAGEKPADIHQQLLNLADRYQNERRERFGAVQSKADLEKLQTALREKFLQLIRTCVCWRL